eukprot:gene26726-32295_t
MARPSHQWDISGVKHMKIEDEVSAPALGLPIVIDANEAERYIESLKCFQLGEVGSKAWMEQHRKMEKLNLQAHHNAMSNSDEYIMEAILTFNKIPVLIHDLLLIEAWKESVYPLLKEELSGKNNMRLYFVLYHEATVVNMLEIFLYYKHFVEAGGEMMIELIDYIARKIVRLNNGSSEFRLRDLSQEVSASEPEAAKKLASALEARTPLEELNHHFQDIEFRVCISAVALARFLSEHAEVLPLSCQSRMTDTHDYLVLLIPLIEQPPWTRRTSAGKWQKLVDHKWTEVKPIDLLKITKLEGQPWIAVYFLLAKECFRERYFLNSFRKGQLLRIRKYIHDVILDQLPFLADIQRYMDELAVTNVPEPSSLNDTVFMFQQVALIRESLLRGQDFPKVAAHAKEHVFTMTDKNDPDLLAMAELYSDDAVEQMVEHDN